MATKAKSTSLCKWKKLEIEDNLKLLQKLINQPQFVCKKCCRAANSKKNLCKALAI
ncbi:hypothetical protein [Motilimonas pumila]|uniref:hypothetical protein n=1 Tax=Motilimonas pumila TaxID=2303987 RepID=UPI0018E0B240|nr:hypothetical protein [Motilimonas pumila]